MAYVKIAHETSAGVIAQNTTGSAATLTTARALAFSGGDVTGTGNFDGSADTAINLTIGSDAVETAMIKDGSVLTAKIGADNITNALIADGAINPENLSGTLGNGSSGNVLISDGDGTFSWGAVLNNRTLTLTGGTGIADTIGTFTANASADVGLTINLDISDLADGGGDLAAGDKFAFYDLDGTDHNNATITQLSAFQAGAGIDANSGVFSINLGSVSSFASIQKGDSIIGLDSSNSNATGKYTVADLSTFQAGTGISTAADGQLHVDASQAITAVTGDFAIAGDLTVSGKTITTTTETLEIADNLIHLNSDLGSSTGVDTGIVAERGSTGDNACLFWDHSKTAWCIGTNSAVGFPSTSSKLMVNVENDGAPSGSETSVGGMVYDTANNEMYIRTS